MTFNKLSAPYYVSLLSICLSATSGMDVCSYSSSDVESGLSEYLCESLCDPSSGRRVLTSSFEAVAAHLPRGVQEEM